MFYIRLVVFYIILKNHHDLSTKTYKIYLGRSKFYFFEHPVWFRIKFLNSSWKFLLNITKIKKLDEYLKAMNKLASDAIKNANEFS